MDRPASRNFGIGVAEEAAPRWIYPLIVSLFFVWGFATVLVDSLIPRLKGLFSLSYSEAMLTQFCFFIAYFVVSVPASLMLGRIGYLRALSAGLVAMAIGCLMLAASALWGRYAGFLLALFVVASGVTMLQVAANPLISLLGGGDARAHARLTLAQGFNALGTTVGPLFGAAFILSAELSSSSGASPLPAPSSVPAQEAMQLGAPFLAIAVGLTILAALFWRVREGRWTPSAAVAKAPTLALLREPRLLFGVVAIFLYVGAEVSIGSILVNYLMQPVTLHLDMAAAGRGASLYWGGAMVGRFLGAALLRRLPAATMLMIVAAGAAALAALSATSHGVVSAAAIVAIGLFNAIMFPTIFGLAIETLGEATAAASGALCMSIVGGAVLPLLTGAVADRAGLGAALFVPVACYLCIAGYGVFAGRVSAVKKI